MFFKKIKKNLNENKIFELSINKHKFCKPTNTPLNVVEIQPFSIEKLLYNYIFNRVSCMITPIDY